MVGKVIQKGFFAKPTLFDNVKENMTIAQDFLVLFLEFTVNNTDRSSKNS